MSARDRAIKQQLREAQAIQAMRFGALEERDRIVIILQDNVADEVLYRTLIAAINGDDK